MEIEKQEKAREEHGKMVELLQQGNVDEAYKIWESIILER
jgi:hypothetical protein